MENVFTKVSIKFLLHSETQEREDSFILKILIEIISVKGKNFETKHNFLRLKTKPISSNASQSSLKILAVSAQLSVALAIGWS